MYNQEVYEATKSLIEEKEEFLASSEFTSLPEEVQGVIELELVGLRNSLKLLASTL